MSNSKEGIVAWVQKNRREVIAFRITNWQGHTLIDCRVFFEGEGGALKPSREGFALNVAKLSELRQAIDVVCAEAERRGLLAAP